MSGAGAAVHGGRFNPKGAPALYLALDPMTAIREASQGFAHKIEPCVLCAYEIDCEDIVELASEAGRRGAGVAAADLSCAWFAEAVAGREPASWRVAARLIDAGAAGAVVPSYAASAGAEDRNLVLWRWGGEAPHRVRVFDPGGRLPKNRLSWD